MKHVTLTNGLTEYRWTQIYHCGHKLPNATLSGTIATARTESKRLKLTDCPKCKLAHLMQGYEAKHGTLENPVSYR